MTIIAPTMNLERAQAVTTRWNGLAAHSEHQWLIVDNTTENRGVLPSMQYGYEHATEDIIAFLHDDLEIKEQGWDARVEREFADPTVGVVGFGGALQHGSDDIYKTPYRLQQLGRSGYLSNTDDAEVHGARFDGACDVAVLDGFALIVRREMLDRAGGFPVATWPEHHCYDYLVCLMAHKLGYRVRLVGIRCHHLGGVTSTTPAIQAWAATTRWGSEVVMHVAGHKLVYEYGRGILPVRCG